MTKNRKKYYYNIQKLAFEEVRISGQKRIRYAVIFSLLALLISSLAGYGFYHLPLSPEKLLLSKKICFLENEISRLTMSCDSLSLLLTGFMFSRDNRYRVVLGLDFVAPAGTKIFATGNGTVTLLKFSRTGYGNELVINHSFGYSTRYAHLQKFFVREGESVKRGQLIALVGNSGRSTGPHLHYEVLYEGKPVNPVFYYSNDLTDSEYHLLTNYTN